MFKDCAKQACSMSYSWESGVYIDSGRSPEEWGEERQGTAHWNLVSESHVEGEIVAVWTTQILCTFCWSYTHVVDISNHYLFLSWGGVGLSPPEVSATICPIVPAADNGWLMWSSRWDGWQGKPKYSPKTCPCTTLSTTNPTRQARTRATDLRSQQLTAWGCQ